MSVFRIISVSRSLLLMAVLALASVASPAYAEVAANAAQTKPLPAVEQVAKINLNTADAQTLADKLNGVGLKKAQAIVAFREQHGPFKTVEELVNVPGIGEATLTKNRDLMSIN